MTIFADEGAAVDEVLKNRMFLTTRNFFSGVTFDDDYIYKKVLAAEKEVSRRLRVFLEPTTMFPDQPAQADIDALNGAAWDIDPAYDYEPDFFRGERWGFIVTKQKPIISVTSIKLAYPNPLLTIFQIPSDWIRLDRKYGHIRLVPASQAFAAPLSAFLMQAMGGGMTIPFMIQVNYVAGLKNAATDWPDLIDIIYKVAVLKIIKDGFLPSSGSISADGLSESISVKVQDFEDSIDVALMGPKGANGGLYSAIHGIPMMAL